MQLDLGTRARPFFSIVLPTFNRAHLIERAVRSVQAQQESSWELLIVDDGSTDNTYEAVRPLLSDERIRYHFATNRGLAIARNLGMQMSVGDYLTFIDSDDEYSSDHLRSRKDYLADHPDTDLLHGGVRVIGDPMVADKFNPGQLIAIADCTVGGTFFIRRTLAEKLEGFRNVVYGDDNDFFQRAEQGGALIRKISTPTYIYYRTEADSLCSIVEREGVDGIARFRAGGEV
jgi:glycosyltransferase involved in cell wall biosynthesis